VICAQSKSGAGDYFWCAQMEDHEPSFETECVVSHWMSHSGLRKEASLLSCPALIIVVSSGIRCRTRSFNNINYYCLKLIVTVCGEVYLGGYSPIDHENKAQVPSEANLNSKTGTTK
jgi:hypothetical protein